MLQDCHTVSRDDNFLLKWEGKPQYLVRHPETVTGRYLDGSPNTRVTNRSTQDGRYLRWCNDRAASIAAIRISPST